MGGWTTTFESDPESFSIRTITASGTKLRIPSVSKAGVASTKMVSERSGLHFPLYRHCSQSVILLTFIQQCYVAHFAHKVYIQGGEETPSTMVTYLKLLW